MDSHEVLKTYAMFYVSENDDFNVKKKLDMLNFIENADESMLMDLFENNEIEAPFDFLETEVEVSDAQLIGESAILIQQATWLMEGDVYLAEDLKNRLKDMLGMETSLKYKISKAAGSVKKTLEKQLDNLQDKISDLKDAIAKGAGKAVDTAKDVAGDVADKAKDVAGDVADKAKDAAGAVSKGAGKAVETAKDVAGDVGEKVSGAAGKAAEFAQQNPGAVGGAVAAAAALTAGVMAYRKFFSKAAQACKSAPDKNQCMAQYKMKAKQAQISTLAAGKSKCAKTKNPQACSAKIDAKIAALKAKMRG
jgi:gas vesicle protein